MANTTIKISQLPNLGNNLTIGTLIPVVSTNGTFTTDKVAVGNIANFILTEAGNLLPEAFVSTIAYSVANAAQPNITSVGTLGINTLHISGGQNGYFLQTDGTGNLGWSAGGGGNGNPGGSNTQVQFNNEGLFGGVTNFTFDVTSNTMSVPDIVVSDITVANTTTFSGGTILYDNGTFPDEYFTIDASIDHSIRLTTSSTIGTSTRNWEFTRDGALVFPGNSSINHSGIDLQNIDLTAGPNGWAELESNDRNNYMWVDNLGAHVATHYLDSPTTWLFGLDGHLLMPGNIDYNGDSEFSIGSNISNMSIYGSEHTTVYSQDKIWDFDNTGNMIFPDLSVQRTAWIGTVSTSNVTGLGNIATINLDGNVSNVLLGDGTFGPGGTGGTGNVTFNDINIIGTGNLKLQPNVSIDSAYLDIYLTGGPDVHITTNNENLILGKDIGPNVKVSFTDVSIKTDSGTQLDAWYNIYGDLNNLSPSNLVVNGSVTYDSTGNIYVLGSIIDTNTFYGDSLFLKYTANGDLLWHKTWTNSSNLQCGSVNASMRYQPISGSASIDTILWASYAQVESVSYIGTMDLDGNLVDLTGAPRAPQQINNYRITDILSLQDIPPGADASYICGQNYDALDTGFKYPSIGGVALDNSVESIQWVFSTPDMNTYSSSCFKALDILTINGYAIYAVGSYYSTDTNLRKAIVGLITSGDTEPVPYLYQIGDNYITDNIWIEDTCTDPGNNIYVAINNDDAGNTNNIYTVIASTDLTGPPGINRWQKKISWIGVVESMGLIHSGGYIYVLAALDGDLALFKLNSTSGALVWARIISSQGYDGEFNGGPDGYNSSSDISIDYSGTYLTFNAFTTDINGAPNSFTMQYPVDGSIIGNYGDFIIAPAETDFTIADFNYTLTDITMSATITNPALDVVTAVLTATATTVGGGWTNVYQQLLVTNIWTFDTAGDINLPANAASFTTGRIQSANGYPTILGYGSGEHGGPELDWMNSDDPATGFGNATVLRNTMYLNDGGLYVGINENNVENVAKPNWLLQPDGGTRFPTLSVERGDNTGGTITGQTLLFGDPTQDAQISTPDGVDGHESSRRLVINPGKGMDGSSGEGGDIYLWAGRGGDGSGSGGDIKIRGGQGGANTTGGVGGDGGYIRIEAGDTASTGGYPGYVEITGGGSSTSQGGYVNITGGFGNTTGGITTIKGGASDLTGGNVNIYGGPSNNGIINEGNVNIGTGGHIWTFDPTGTLTLPDSTEMGEIEGANTFGFYNSNANTEFLIELGPTNVWRFDGATGGLTFPDATVQTTAYPGNTLTTVAKTGSTQPGRGEVATITLGTTNNPALTPGVYPGITVGLGLGFTVTITVAGNGDITSQVTTSEGGFYVGQSGTIPGSNIGGTTPADDLSFTVATLTNIVVATVIDLTKSVNKLNDGYYSLADGVEGQLMYIVSRNGTDPSNVRVDVANFRQASGTFINGLLVPFRWYNGIDYVDNNGMCTLLYTDGAWQQSNGLWD